MNILFISATRIGDAVLASGLLSYLLDRYPGAAVTIAAGPAAAPLFTAVPGLAEIITLPKRPLRMHWLHLYRRVALQHWDLVIDLRGSGLSYLLWARERRVMAKGEPDQHRVVQLARLFDLAPPPAPRLWLTAQHEAEANTLLAGEGPVLAIGPAANWRGKTWRAERFAELAVRLTSPDGLLPGARVAVLAAAHERAQAQPVLASVPAERTIDLVGRLDLLTAAAVLRRAAVFIGNDTGIMHIAAAMNTPTLGLFGPSRPEIYAPWGDHTAVIATPVPYDRLFPADFDHRTTDTLMDTLTVDAVEAAARQLLSRMRPKAA